MERITPTVAVVAAALALAVATFSGCGAVAPPPSALGTSTAPASAPKPSPFGAVKGEDKAARGDLRRRASSWMRNQYRLMAAKDTRVCTKRLSRHYLYAATGLRGRAAVAECERRVAGGTEQYKLIKLLDVQEGDAGHVLVRVVDLSVENGQQHDHVYDLVESSDGLKIWEDVPYNG